MRYIFILLLLVSTAYGQFAPTSAKTKFVNGIAIGSRDTSQFTAADTIALTIARDSVMYYRYRGFWRPIATGGNLSAYKLISDTLFNNGYTTRARLKQGLDSLGAVKLNISDTATMLSNRLRISDTASMLAPFIQYSDTTGLLSQVVRTFGTQTVGGNKTFSNDIVVNGLTVGRGAGNNASNSVLGASSLSFVTSGSRLSAFGERALNANTSGADNTAIGWYSLDVTTTGGQNTGIGSGALGTNTTGSNNTAVGYGAGEYISGLNSNSTGSNSIYIGHLTQAEANGQTNQTVIGYQAIGNGSNTVTIGNSSVTNNYFTGNIRGGAFIRSGGTSSQFLKADGSVDGTAYGTGSVTSVGLSSATSGVTIGSSPVTTSGTITLAIATASGSQQGLLSSTDWTTFNNKAPSVAGGYLPLSGGTLTGGLVGTTGSFASNGSSATFAINHTSGSGLGLDITKGGNGEGLRVNKTSGSGNAATIIGTLEATTLVKTGGTSSQFLMADGSVNTSVLPSGAYLPLSGGTLTGGLSGTTASFSGLISGVAGLTNPAVGTNAGTSFALNNSVDNAYGIGTAAALVGQFDMFFQTGDVNGGGFRFYKGASEIAKITSVGGMNLTGALSGTSLSMSGIISNTDQIRANTNNANGTATIRTYFNNTAIAQFVNNSQGASTTNYGFMQRNDGANFIGGTSLDVNSVINGTSLSMSGNGTFANVFTGNGNYLSLSGAASTFTRIYRSSGLVLESNTFTTTLTDAGNLLIGTTTDNGARLQVSGAGTFSGNVGIGTTSPAYKLHVVTDAVAGRQNMSNISRTTGNWVRFTNPQYSTDASMGLILRVFPDSDSRQGAGIIASGGLDNGITDLDLFVSNGSSSSTSYSALSIKGSTGNVGIGTTSPSVALHVIGAGTFSSSVTATGFIVSSDLRYKNIISQDGDLYKYTLKADETNQVHYGYIAQEVEKTLPFAVTTNADGYKAVNYIEVLTLKVRELEKKIEQLEKRNK